MFDAMEGLSTCGRLYNRGKALGEELKRKIIQGIIQKRGDFTTALFVGSFFAIPKDCHCCSGSGKP